MTAHMCAELTPGCYRCDLNRDEIADFQRERRDLLAIFLLGLYPDAVYDADRSERDDADAILAMLDKYGYL